MIFADKCFLRVLLDYISIEDILATQEIVPVETDLAGQSWIPGPKGGQCGPDQREQARAALLVRGGVHVQPGQELRPDGHTQYFLGGV